MLALCLVLALAKTDSVPTVLRSFVAGRVPVFQVCEKDLEDYWYSFPVHEYRRTAAQLRRTLKDAGFRKYYNGSPSDFVFWKSPWSVRISECRVTKIRGELKEAAWPNYVDCEIRRGNPDSPFLPNVYVGGILSKPVPVIHPTAAERKVFKEQELILRRGLTSRRRN